MTPAEEAWKALGLPDTCVFRGSHVRRFPEAGVGPGL